MSACSSHNSCSFAACPTHLLLAAASCCRPVLWLPSKTSITCIAAVHQPAFLPREKRGCITTHWQVCHRGCSLCQGLTSYKPPPPPPCARHPPMAPLYPYAPGQPFTCRCSTAHELVHKQRREGGHATQTPASPLLNTTLFCQARSQPLPPILRQASLSYAGVAPLISQFVTGG
jgi:hypothetical protein